MIYAGFMPIEKTRGTLSELGDKSREYTKEEAKRDLEWVLEQLNKKLDPKDHNATLCLSKLEKLRYRIDKL